MTPRYLHTRFDLALKGAQMANRMVQQGKWSRVPGVIEIEEA